MALFDTDVLIDHLRGNEGAKDVLYRLRHERNCCSVITTGEVLFGMKAGEKEKTLALLKNLEELTVDKDSVRLAHEIKTNAPGYHLELYDCIIAATAIQYNLILVTRHARHYPDKRVKLIIPDY